MKNRIDLAKRSLTGIAIGDAFGDSFFRERAIVESALENRFIPETEWRYTDDTIMAIPLLKSLELFGEINQDFVANQFAQNFLKDRHRGYGPSMHRKLLEFDVNKNWLEISKSSFNGTGSMGNGSAMRVALIGAYFYDDLSKVAEQAKLSSEITHYNNEAIAGAISVAIATALCTKSNELNKEAWLDTIIDFTPESDLKYKIKKIKHLPKSYDIRTIVTALGNGTKMLAQDTVPIALWNVYHYLGDFEESLWNTVSALGDRDTTCAIVGGINMMCSKESCVPKQWGNDVEKWNESIFYK
ncbi:ADP-ribosylglycohydrolase family protein [uncultured Tenacibaculum sp.]|uniref:ADP-ribosylglycohydrolase family protein n=1 Tax=uncultured Tenacibaculum sp. TaxID=174713 RepID=UPI0026288194|nr:ADP-ribosylglycohydrolase family protein [uncultured Tenacibaculum sp.]